MDSVIRSAPLLLKRSVRYTQIAVHKIQGMERAYDVLFIGTGSAHYASTSGELYRLICKYTFVCFNGLLLCRHTLSICLQFKSFPLVHCVF